ncbi:hypothetical protein CHLRE_07g320450v5 [Chlamydomonas reinhardtii]|uniref:Uncharacterized protein n=1 Tax=Chlamydomonas reinhardtii TaxID=3055 RepID=A0A2K3DJ04_CHLRE|nr:uncharacterized protein CHLRE_07g320400v5 [Chlamydomonas reinhardtii]XP_042922536.1 uncharacterized protein CHLRE_07g320450v5 [Chlamydomonas reinhardtii]XP_042922537.1 uncharacterized protein CHLRE_07g320450v5 [Chlamydomonas reinhardtii]PNW80512.1 hypothetical protein CHLRE_07g320400v5 [Chlamydomonas reinhardtii]PNW80513.1 hypothetical protein CHLRE_07g320450v5 [Chlamydomonas reinhardtii]PNW80514.1 hypothetical protein CHLRE_07g320450v5 [Chlamydomonas reinhardtii]
MQSATMIAGRRMAVAPTQRPACRFVVKTRMAPIRAAPQDESAPSTSAPTPTPAPAPLASNVSGESPAATLNILGPVQEAINGRSAMLGFVAAVVSESLTHQSIFSQIAGKYVDGEIVEAPFGTSTLLFFAVVLLTTMATLVPKMVHSLNVDSRSFGPFTPGLELTLGRVAQLGFAGLLIVELVKGSALLG